MSDLVEKQKLKEGAGLEYMPTDLTYDLRMALGGHKREEFLSWGYQWEDKPHRLVFAACGEAEYLAARIEALEAEVKVWQGYTKMAVWSDSEECKVLTAEVERLLKSRNRWATKYNDLLAKRRAEDGYDVYAAAREEYRKKISEQAARIEKLEAALRPFADESLWCGPQHEFVTVKRSDCDEARAALEDKA